MGTVDLNEQTGVATSEKWPGMSMTWDSVRVSFHEKCKEDARDGP